MHRLWFSFALVGCGNSGGSLLDATIGDGTSADAGAVANVAFFTADVLTSGGGLAAADAHCMQQAAEGGLAGTFVAWRSTSTVDARDRLAGSSGWVRTDNLPFVNSVDDLLAGRIYHALARDQFGASNAGAIATGTAADGTRTTETCSDWTSSVPNEAATAGNLAGTTRAWTQGSGGVSCAFGSRVYCFGLGKITDVRPTAMGKLAFATDGLWTPGGGLAAADQVCQAEADAASRPGTFKAMLATATGYGLERFTLGGTWVRPDQTIALFPDKTSFSTNINVTLSGAYVTGPAWTGSPQLDRCLEWTSSAATDNGTWSNIEVGVAIGSPQPCDTPMRLRCFED